MSQQDEKSTSEKSGQRTASDDPEPDSRASLTVAEIEFASRRFRPNEAVEFEATTGVTISIPFGAGVGAIQWTNAEGESAETTVTASQPYVLGADITHSVAWTGTVDLLVATCDREAWQAEAGNDVDGVVILYAAEHDAVLWRLGALCRDLCLLGGSEHDLPLNIYTGAALVRRLGQLLRDPVEHRQHLRRLTPDQWDRVDHFLEAQLKYDIQVADLANQVGLGVGYFSELFKNTMGCAPFHYIKQRRLIRAHALLMQGGQDWKRVAALVGYSNSEHFSEVFRKFWGVTARALLAQVNRSSAVHRH